MFEPCCRAGKQREGPSRDNRSVGGGLSASPICLLQPVANRWKSPFKPDLGQRPFVHYRRASALGALPARCEPTPPSQFTNLIDLKTTVFCDRPFSHKIIRPGLH